MVHDPALLDRLERLLQTPFNDPVWRHMFNGLDPQLPNTRGARWNPPGTAAIYLSLDPDTALAEADYSLAVQPVRPRPRSRELYEVSVALSRVVDLRERAILIELGIDEEALRAFPPAACQAVGGACAWLGCDGILVPSARVEGSNLVALVNLMDPEATLEVVHRTEVSTDQVD